MPKLKSVETLQKELEEDGCAVVALIGAKATGEFNVGLQIPGRLRKLKVSDA